MNQTVAKKMQPKNLLRVVLLTVGLFVASIISVILLSELSWVIPLTHLHIAGLAFARREFSVSGFSNASTKVAFATLAALSFAMAAAETSRVAKLDQENSPPAAPRTPPIDETNIRPTAAVPAPAPASASASAPATPPSATRPPPPTSAVDAGVKSPARPSVKEVSTSVDDILRTYADNQIAGERKFSNAKLTISGRVVRVREAFGTGILVLGAASGNSLELYFTESGEATLGEVSPGQSVKAVCYVIIEAMGAVALSDCRSVK